tara:strand:+ start:3052 stop:3822 length:771 start_codon:yes stop_codon:yes gene_type:complete
MHLLIDADMLLFQAVKICEVEIEWMPDVITTHLNVNEVKFLFDSLLNQKKEQTKVDRLTLCWTAEDNFRKKIDPTYKGNRRSTWHRIKPVGFKEARRRIEDSYPSECWYRLEADDVLGILQTRSEDEDPIIWSGDKDLKQIPGYHLSDDGEVYLITEDEADAYFYRQCLIGDAVDGYSGCPSIGTKTAEKLIPLEDFDSTSAWGTVINSYKKKGLSEEYALTQARLARILRATDYPNDSIALWTPPTLLTTDTTKP